VTPAVTHQFWRGISFGVLFSAAVWIACGVLIYTGWHA
jgi:hypothetical protein